MVHAADRTQFRRNLDNALPSLLNTLDVLQKKKACELSDESEKDENIETLMKED